MTVVLEKQQTSAGYLHLEKLKNSSSFDGIRVSFDHKNISKTETCILLAEVHLLHFFNMDLHKYI